MEKSGSGGLTARNLGRPEGATAEETRKRLLQAFNVAALESFGDFSRAEVAACGALLDYVELTQAGKRPALVPPRRERADGTMEIDPATRRNLELVKSLDGRRDGSLLATIDRTLTGPGARLLAERIAAPLTDRAEIERRLDLVQLFVERPTLRERVREALKRTPDIERALTRLSRATARARTLRDKRVRADKLAALPAVDSVGGARVVCRVAWRRHAVQRARRAASSPLHHLLVPGRWATSYTTTTACHRLRDHAHRRAARR